MISVSRYFNQSGFVQGLFVNPSIFKARSADFPGALNSNLDSNRADDLYDEGRCGDHTEHKRAQFCADSIERGKSVVAV